jgi:hypothetical protein
VSGVTEVRVTRSRDVLEGQVLPVTGRLRRHSRLELVVVLPDGTSRLIPQEWTGDGWLATLEATHAYGLSRQTLLQRVKRGEIRAVYLRTGRKKGLRIAPPAQQAGLF